MVSQGTVENTYIEHREHIYKENGLTGYCREHIYREHREHSEHIYKEHIYEEHIYIENMVSQPFLPLAANPEK
jgi:hypothetical protein